MFTSTLATGASWRTAVSLSAGDINSGSLVLLSGDAAGQVKSYAFTALSGSGLRPGSAAQASLTVRNGGTSPLRYGLSQTTTTGSATLASFLRLRVDAVPRTGDCSSGVDAPAATTTTGSLYTGDLVGASSTSTRALATGAVETLCVRVTVSTDAPKSVQGSTVQATLTFGAQMR